MTINMEMYCAVDVSSGSLRLWLLWLGRAGVGVSSGTVVSLSLARGGYGDDMPCDVVAAGNTLLPGGGGRPCGLLLFST
jgi:hypothetical protein